MSRLTEKTIGELLEHKFFIPSYQRGYRWTEIQVEDLLNDIDSFVPHQIERTDKKTWYCLQPVVLKECDEETKLTNSLEGTWYEVIDGQQRLTSIFLIIHYANEMWIGKQKTAEFQIKYETRDQSFKFLKSQKIDESQDEAIISFKNIDFHHITKAYNKIHDWVKNYKRNFLKEFDNNDFQSKLKSNSKVLWYEVPTNEDAIKIFTRINMGKIPLTNAELIKALFLNSSNFTNSNVEEIRLKQLEIASEWDRIEYSLQSSQLWYFINNSKNELPTRIEYVFQITFSIAKEECLEVQFRKDNKIESEDKIEQRRDQGHLTIEERFGNDEHSTFRYFSEKFQSKNKNEIEINWKEVKRMFQTIEEWFYDRELYHKVGFLLATGTKIIHLLKESFGKQKSTFKETLNEKIAVKIKCQNSNDLVYGNWSIKNTLLLHNIKTMLNNEKETSRFPFDRYKKDNWDIEHIHAIATKVKVKKEDQQKWLLNNYFQSKQHNNEVINFEIDEIIKGVKQMEDEEFKRIIEYVLGEEDDNIRNLCLLDRGTNRSYKNDSFKEKRRKIIENEKKGTFIPVCTKNVFMKYYSKELKDLELWNEIDRDAYLDNIKATVFEL